MIKILKLILRLAPLFAGAAYVGQQLEKKQKKKFSFKRLIILLLLVLVILGTIFSGYVWSHYDDEFIGKTDNCAVVFGAAVWKGDQPSHALDDRTQAAIDLYQNEQVGCLVFSGGASKYGAHEVEVMTRLALERGVERNKITEDRYGNNTLATLLNLAPGSGYVMVSNDFHLARIGIITKRLGFENYHLHAAPYQYARYTRDLEYFGREVVGSILVWLKL